MKSKRPNLIKFLTLCFAPAITGAMIQSAHAASATWTGGAGGTGTNLSDGANWSSGSAAFVSGDVVTFDNTTALGTLTWNANLGPGFGATDGVIIDYTGTNNLTLDGVAGSPGLQWGLGNINIATGAGAFSFGNGLESTTLVFRGAGNIQTYTNESSNTATFGADMLWRAGGGADKTLNIEGSGDWLFNAALRIDATQGQSALTVIKNSAGIVNFAAANNLASPVSTLRINNGTLKVTSAGSLGALGSYPGSLVVDSVFSYESSANQTITGIVSGVGEINQTAGILNLTGANTFSGSANITGGTLSVGGTGSLECAITVNGASAKYLHNSTTASSQDITLTLGTVGGNGTISSVTAADNSGNFIANGNGNSAPLTVDTLTFNGDGGLSVTDDGVTSTSGIVVTGTLTTTPASGTITVNASNSFWDSGITYDLLSAGTFNAALSDFTLGTINGVTGRQAPSLVATASGIGLLISGDNPKWSGADNTNWVVGSTGPNSNWRLISLNTPTDYIQGDVVLFDDSAAGATVTVAISAADVSPAVVNFNNSKPYIINGPFGIASGALNKNGTGNATIAAPNTYSGGTTINAGTLTLSGAGTLGATSGALIAAGGNLNLGGSSQTVGSLLVNGEASIQNGTLTAPALIAAIPAGTATISATLDLGTGTINKSGPGNLVLSASPSYSGATTISNGTLTLSGAGDLGSTSGVTLSGGAFDLGGSTQIGLAINISAAATAGDTIFNGTIEPASFSINSTGGIATVSANIIGSTGVTRNGGGGTLSLTGTNTFTGPLNFAGNGTVSIDGGSNTGGGAVTYNSFGSTLTVNSGSYLTSGTTSSGFSEFRFLNLNGGVFETEGNLFSSTLAISTVFNGGTLKCGNAAGITWYDANNQVVINAGGATIDTTVGSITLGLNTGGPAALANPLTRLNGTASGTITLLGGNSLVSGIANNGILDIQDSSTWDLHGVASSVAGIEGNGTVTSSTGSAVLTINAAAGPFLYSGNITGGGKVSLVKQGTGTQALAGSTYQGDITVALGTLEVTNNSATTFANYSKVSLVTGAVLDLPNNVTDVIAGLIVDGNGLLPGTYDAASPETTGLITGNGKLQVVAGFANWMTQFATLSAADRLANADPDADGIPNLVEYAIDGQDPTVANPAAGSFTGNALSFTKRAGTIGLTYSIVESTDLGITDAWTEVSGGSYVNDANTISYTLTPGSPVDNFIRLQVTQN